MSDPFEPKEPSTLLSGRQKRETVFRTPDGRLRTIRLYDAYTAEDVLANMSKAYLTSLSKGTPYTRPETPSRLKKTLTSPTLTD